MTGRAGRVDETTMAPADFVEASYWLVLGREPDGQDVKDCVRSLDLGQPRRELVVRLLSSTEFHLRLQAWREDRPDGRDPETLQRGLARFGAADLFVALCYRFLLGRDADPGGLAHYASWIESTRDRAGVVRTLASSPEFIERLDGLGGGALPIPQDVQLCELANPAKWDNPEWMSLLRELQAAPEDKRAMHRKAYEYTQTLFGLRRLGRLRPDARVLSVGAGHECILYWLANHVGSVIGTDMYEGRWQSDRAMEGDIRIVASPREFAPFAYREDRLVCLQMDGRALAFADEAFEIVYSLSSIEHFGGVDGARAAVLDMARVLKPGGVLVLATEWCLQGPGTPEVFQPAEVRALLDVPGLRLVQPIDDRVWDRYAARAVDLQLNPYRTPHMIVRDGETVFTSVIAFLEKSPPGVS